MAKGGDFIRWDGAEVPPCAFCPKKMNRPCLVCPGGLLQTAGEGVRTGAGEKETDFHSSRWLVCTGVSTQEN